MVYYRFTNMERRGRTHRGQHSPGENAPEPLLREGAGETFGFPLPKALSRELPIPDRSAHRGPGHRRCGPFQSDDPVHRQKHLRRVLRRARPRCGRVPVTTLSSL